MVLTVQCRINFFCKVPTPLQFKKTNKKEVDLNATSLLVVHRSGVTSTKTFQV